ncbi:MAG: thioesterase family protein [Peptococcaceae bacterium]|jgi:predicted thioesterase|nr:thioesterase family protein [Peptococcaceae bacterium]MDH7523702.1 thioesterase family protein [Peptococcaceae bacterium]
MDSILKPGLRAEDSAIVTESNVASSFVSGAPDVYATPSMIGLMENAAYYSVQKHLPDGWTTVGVFVDVKHLAATPIGMKVRAAAELIEVEGYRLKFKVEAYDEKEKIGEGFHGRFIVNTGKFRARVSEKSST